MNILAEFIMMVVGGLAIYVAGAVFVAIVWMVGMKMEELP